MEKKSILFIVNPISGRGRGEAVEETIRRELDRSIYDLDIYFTTGPGDAIEVSKRKAGTVDIIVAVGGDGTVNEVARGLIGSSTVMGIIPRGSGNGLARYLNIPLRVKAAIKALNKGTTKTIDTALINDEVFLNMAGVGFDARVAHAYMRYSDKRGFISYVKSVFTELLGYEEKEFEMIVENTPIKRGAFVLSFSNSSQYGNNAHIAPNAEIDDGLLEVCFLKKFPLWAAPVIAFHLFNKTIDRSKYYTSFRCRELELEHSADVEFHIDGEAISLPPKRVKIKINPHSLKVITGTESSSKALVQIKNQLDYLFGLYQHNFKGTINKNLKEALNKNLRETLNRNFKNPFSKHE